MIIRLIRPSLLAKRHHQCLSLIIGLLKPVFICQEAPSHVHLFVFTKYSNITINCRRSITYLAPLGWFADYWRSLPPPGCAVLFPPHVSFLAAFPIAFIVKFHVFVDTSFPPLTRCQVCFLAVQMCIGILLVPLIPDASPDVLFSSRIAPERLPLMPTLRYWQTPAS